jgi:MOSC domain-containing protein YiiM
MTPQCAAAQLHVRRHVEAFTLIGKVVSIYIAPLAGSQLETIEVAELRSGKGIAGDRYFQQQGTFSKQLESGADWEVTLIESEEIRNYNEAQSTDWHDGAFRRNIVTRDIRINDLVGRQISVGTALLEGIRLCEPCAYLGSMLGPEIVKGMAHRAGLRARILASGYVRPGDSVEVTGAD